MILTGQFQLVSQSNPTYTVFPDSRQGLTLIPGASMSFPVTNKTVSGSTLLKQRNKTAKLSLKLDVGDDYVVKDPLTWLFKAQVVISYQFIGSPAPVYKTLIIDNTKPEYLKVEDVLPILNPFSGASSPALTINVISVDVFNNSSPTSTTLLPSGSLLYNFIQNNLRFTAKLEREYEIDVRLASGGLMSTAPIIHPISIADRLVTFSWIPVSVDAYPNYEVQVLKLYNTDNLYQNSLNDIKTTVDWSKALRVETQNFKNSIKLTMAEGTGFYIWRVRPIGNYYKDGIANSENYGAWSTSVIDLTTTTLNKNNLLVTPNPSPFAFYFTDPDEKLNWIYSRVFTEGDKDDLANPSGVKSSEGISYADGLLNSRQNQKYNSSEITTIVSQTIYDYSGRPALSTIPVPVNGNLNGYKIGFVTNPSGTLYTAQMFDTDDNDTSPEKVNDGSNVLLPSDYKYYSSGGVVSGTITNENVPSAEGYPFKRTKFKTDGTNRVTEESGVGKTHSLGTRINGQGRTTRVMFGTPSDDELIRIFGDEAPLAESVIKTTTIDPNDIISVSYTSKEGKTIATALVSDNSENLVELKKSHVPYTLSNSVDQNTVIDGKIIGSKRIVVAEDGTVINLSYSPGAPGIANGCSGGDCNLKLRFYLVDLKTNITYVSDADPSTLLEKEPFPQSSNFSTTFNNPWKLVGPGSSYTPTGAGFNQITLPEGEYLFVKEVCSANGNTTQYAESVIDEENDKTKLILDAIVARMQGVTSAATYSVFETWYGTLKTLIDNYEPSPTPAKTQALVEHLGINPVDLPIDPTDVLNYSSVYTFSLTTFTLSAITQTTNDPTTNDIGISTGCCGTLKVPIPKPDICFLCVGNPVAPVLSDIDAMKLANYNVLMDANTAVATFNDPNPTTFTLTPYGIADFKAVSTFSNLTVSDQLTAVKSLVELEFIIPLKLKLLEENFALTDLWKLAPGFTYESLNYMFSNMLISRYFTGKAVKDPSGTWYELKEDGTALAFPTVHDYNYDCKKMYQAWTNAINLLNSFEVEGEDDIVGSFNDQDGENSGQNEADDDENMDDASVLEKAVMTKKMSEEMEDFNDSDDGKIKESKLESITSLVSNFMEFVGAQYAAVIDGQALPSYIEASTAHPFVPADYDQTTPNGNFVGNALITSADITMSGVHTGTVPLLFEIKTAGTSTSVVTSTMTCGTASNIEELYYPYTLKPEWMFKYYVYNLYDGTNGAIDDNDRLIPHQVLVDLHRGYNTPESYVINNSATNGYNSSGAPLCNILPVLTFTAPSSAVYTYTNTHECWSAAERMDFYKEIKGSPKCYEIKGVVSVNATNIVCPTKTYLVGKANEIIDQNIIGANNLKSYIKSAFYNELVSSCYKVVKCKTPGNTGEVTDKEIDLMVDVVIEKCSLQLVAIKTKLNFTTPPPGSVPSCNLAPAAGLSNSTYSDNESDLPYAIKTDCQEINLLKPTNTLTVTSYATIDLKYFADCDQKIIDMIEKGAFIPYIPTINSTDCPKVVPSYISSSADPATQCLPTSDYAEKPVIIGTPYKKYSRTYSSTGGGIPQ